ncbi:MAG: FtsX-like permease family protein [Acidimicrobiales bacterium]
MITGEDLQAEQAEQFDEFIGIFRTVLLVFAIIILVVSAFVIYNVFSILISQRIRELGLLRAIGATGRQVTGALLGEAAMVGVFATVVGTVLGIGFGVSLRWLLQQFEFGPPGNDILLKPATFVWGAAVGIGVTMASAISPALRARHVSPMAALREDARIVRRDPARNVVFGAVVAVVGWAIIVLGIATEDWKFIIPLGLIGAFASTFGIRRLDARIGRFATFGLGLVLIGSTFLLDLGTGAVLALLAVAAVTTFLGVNTLSPLMARPVSSFLGRWPLALLLGAAGAITALLGITGIAGSLYLVWLAARDVATDFDTAGIVALVGTLLPLVLSYLIFRVGRRSVDASFILGWRWPNVIGGASVFLTGLVGTTTTLVGLAGIASAEWSQVMALPIGLLALAVARDTSRVLPPSMKANARMARENAGRSPRRTASAAAALMIGLALVSTATVVAESFKATFADILRNSVTADFFISPTDQQNPAAGFSPELASGLMELPEVDTVLRFQFALEAYRTAADDIVRDSSATDLRISLDHIDPDFAELDESALDRTAVWVHRDFAEGNGFSLGSTFPITFNDGVTEMVHIAGIFKDSSIYGNRVVDLGLWEDHFPGAIDQFVSVTTADGVDEERARAAIETVTDGYTQVNVDTRQEFQDRQSGAIDQALAIFNVLLLSGHRDRAPRHRHHLGAVGVRTHPGARSRASRRHDLTADAQDGAVRGGDHRGVRWGPRRGHGHGVRFGGRQPPARRLHPDARDPGPALMQYLVIASVAGIAAAIIRPAGPPGSTCSTPSPRAELGSPGRRRRTSRDRSTCRQARWIGAVPGDPMFDDQVHVAAPVTVVVAGPDPRLIEPAAGVDITARTTTGHEAVTGVLIDPPDVLALDAAVTDPDVRAVARRIREWSPATRVLVVVDADDEHAYTALVAGAAGAVLRSDTASDHADALAHRPRRVAPVAPYGRTPAPRRRCVGGTVRRPLVPTAHTHGHRARGSLPTQPRRGFRRIAAAHCGVTARLVNLHAGFAVGKLHRYVLGAARTPRRPTSSAERRCRGRSGDAQHRRHVADQPIDGPTALLGDPPNTVKEWVSDRSVRCVTVTPRRQGPRRTGRLRRAGDRNPQ